MLSIVIKSDIYDMTVDYKSESKCLKALKGLYKEHFNRRMNGHKGELSIKIINHKHEELITKNQTK